MSLSSIEQKLDDLGNRINNHLDHEEEKDRNLAEKLESMHSDIKGMENRIRKLETFSDRAKGVIAAMVAGWTVFIGWFSIK